MTHPQASPDGTGTQTDEVEVALANIRGAANDLSAYGYLSWSAAVRESASVLSAEIERLTRRVEELERPKTIYDQRSSVQAAAEQAGPRLYNALRQLLDAVEERQGLRESIESIVISDAHSALLVAISPAEAALASAAAPDERVQLCEATEILREISDRILATGEIVIPSARIAAFLARTPDQNGEQR